jgi:hypothetical protein
MILLPVCLWLRSQPGRRVLERLLGWLEKPWFLLALVVPSALSDILLRPFWPGDADNLLADWGNFTHKLTFFAAGFVLASSIPVYERIAEHRRKFLVAAIATFTVLALVRALATQPTSTWLAGYRLLNNLQIWLWLLSALGYGRRYLSFNHPFLRYATEAVYPFYILHQTVIIILAYDLAYVNWSIAVKFPLVAGATFLIIWLIYAVAIRPWNLVRVVFGMKWQRPRRAESAAGGAARAWLSSGDNPLVPPTLPSSS